eukprot:TRINITY_DN9962_c0_g1_i1.p1 TRINITY_DN9962_c0_g1~~TRINITY_DN9962_c0_g1_i1.p1  ORF type:complete len:120 (+),score=12.13 TRINITY_DN9962_c0_g1_i1:124-483(+)
MAMRFCQECNNLLRPKEDKHERVLMFSCRNCDHEEPSDDYCVYRNILKHNADEPLKETYLKDIVSDPTLPRSRDIQARCENCESKDAVFFQSPEILRREARMTLIYVCCACRHSWKGSS